MPEEDKIAVRASNEVLSESQLDALEWALNFMRNYERKKIRRNLELLLENSK